MDKLRKAYDVYSEDGIIELINTTKNYYLSGLESAVPAEIYKLISPDYTNLAVNGFSAKFDMSIVSPGNRPDFRRVYYKEKSIISSFLKDIEEDDVFYDIGANIGLYSSFVGRKIKSDGEVVAFEPNPISVPVLYNNLVNNCQSFSILQVAASDKTEFTKLDISDFTKAKIKSKNGIDIKTEEINAIVQKYNVTPPTAAKIDVEGAELQVLKGFGGTIEKLELLLVEIHPEKMKQFGGSKGRIINILTRNFDNITEIETDGNQSYIKATINER